jgi:hypothetical protein
LNAAILLITLACLPVFCASMPGPPNGATRRQYKVMNRSASH